MISKLLRLKQPILKVSLFEGKTFEVEVHPKIAQLSNNEDFVSVYWIAMDQVCKFTQKVLRADRY
jgi:hypothetical protein